MPIETVLFALATITVSILSMFSGGGKLPVIGAGTFIGWVYYLTVKRYFAFSLEQVLLAAGDLVQVAIFLWCMKMDRRSPLVMVLMASCFIFMIGLHLSLFTIDGKHEQPYHTLLNWAYAAQLALIGGMAVFDHAKGHAHVFRNPLRGWRHIFSRVVHK